MRGIISGLVALAAVCVALPAQALSDGNVVEWVGEGAHKAYVVVDFAMNPSGTIPDAFVFGVRFDADSISGLEALEMVSSATALTHVDAGGGYVTDISYTFRNTTYSGSGEYPPWWSYWESTDAGSTWTLSNTGVAGHMLSDGDASGWQHTYDTTWPPVDMPIGPYFQPNPVDDMVVEWAGRGPKCAYVIVDFSDSTTQSAEFAFGVSFTSGTITGLDAMNMLANETGLQFTDAGGGYVTYIRYDHQGMMYEGLGDYPPWWSYWESTNSGTDWVLSSSGCSAHQLDNFDASGWVNTFDTSWPPTVPPNGPRIDPDATPTATPTPTATATPTVTATPTPTGTMPPDLSRFEDAQTCSVESNGHFYAGVSNFATSSWDGVDAWNSATLNYTLQDDAWIGAYLYDYDAGVYVEAFYILGDPLL